MICERCGKDHAEFDEIDAILCSGCWDKLEEIIEKYFDYKDVKK